tara:strand:+ start:162 stop:665 length:504 start_codon:yes stop_codon:yes gene_type:complete
MAKVSKSRVVWAINETQSMRQASQLLGLAYNTFKKYAKLYEVWAPLDSAAGIRTSNTTGFKPVELEDIFSGKHPSYSNTKLLHRCFREGYLAEECGNCGYDEYRAYDMSKPLMLDYLDDDGTNKELANLRVLCYNCFFIMKGKRLKVKVPKNIRGLQKAVGNLFSSE